MKDRGLTLLLALGALVAFYILLVGPEGQPEEDFSRPLSTELRPNGYFAVRHWLETQGVHVIELRHRYDWLLRAAELPEKGNLMVTTIPHKRYMRHSELRSLRKWSQNGNAILVAAGVFDTPEWAVPDTDLQNQLYQLSRITIALAEPVSDEVADDDERDHPAPSAFGPPIRLKEAKRGFMLPHGDHPLVRGVKSVHALSEFPAGKFMAVTPVEAPMLSLMFDKESGEDALWLTWSEGGGPVLVSGYGSILTNKMLARADNAELMANVVAQFLGPGGHVVFDDMHQGAASLYDAEAFFGDPRLHATIAWIFALWFLWVLGGTRMPPPAARPAPVRERSFVDSTGNFFARVLDRRLVARRMFANFFNDWRRSLGFPPDGEPLWEWMRGSGAVPLGGLERIEAIYARVESGKRVNLIELHNRLQQLRKQLT